MTPLETPKALQDVAEALAVSWKERRKEMVNLRRARKFTQAGESKRSFNCKLEMVGLWKRFRMSQPRAFQRSSNSFRVSAPMMERPQPLSRTPKLGELTNNCSMLNVGDSTCDDCRSMLLNVSPLLNARPMLNVQPLLNVRPPTSNWGLPTILGGRTGTIKAAIVQGSAPLLISRNALKTLKAVIDFAASEITLFESRVTVPLCANQAGQFTVELMGEPDVNPQAFSEVMSLGNNHEAQSTASAESEAPAMPISEPPRRTLSHRLVEKV